MFLPCTNLWLLAWAGQWRPNRHKYQNNGTTLNRVCPFRNTPPEPRNSFTQQKFTTFLTVLCCESKTRKQSATGQNPGQRRMRNICIVWQETSRCCCVRGLWSSKNALRKMGSFAKAVHVTFTDNWLFCMKMIWGQMLCQLQQLLSLFRVWRVQQ